MRRDFSETAEQSLKDLIDQINDEQWCKWTDAIGDFFIFGLDIQNYLDNVDQYHKKILDKKNTTKDAIEKIFQDVRAVDAAYHSIFQTCCDHVKEQREYIEQLVSCIDTTGESTFNFENITSTYSISIAYFQNMFDFKDNLKSQFGFDDETVEIMWNVFSALKQKYPNASQLEIDWRFTRLMGGFSYDGIEWDDAAGGAIDQYHKRKLTSEDELYPSANTESPTYYLSVRFSEKEYFTEYLEIKENDYVLLRYKVRLQNLITSKPERYLLPFDVSLTDKQQKDLEQWRATYIGVTGDQCTNEEFLQIWNKQYNIFVDKSDFAHQQITTSAILAEKLNKDGFLSNVGAFGGDKKVTEKAGWLGDATLNLRPSFGPEDYKADLDAANITSYMNNRELSYVEATNQYYNDLLEGQSRATIFLETTPLNEVKQKIISTFTTKLNFANKILGNNRLPVIELGNAVGLNTGLAMEIIKIIAPDTYNFIKSLEQESPTMLDYSQ